MQVTVKISDKLADEARERGVPIDVYIQGILARHAHYSDESGRPGSIDNVIRRIRDLRTGNQLDGLTIKQLISEGRKY